LQQFGGWTPYRALAGIQLAHIESHFVRTNGGVRPYPAAVHPRLFAGMGSVGSQIRREADGKYSKMLLRTIKAEEKYLPPLYSLRYSSCLPEPPAPARFAQYAGFAVFHHSAQSEHDCAEGMFIAGETE
jgi:hypothetical protein